MIRQVLLGGAGLAAAAALILWRSSFSSETLVERRIAPPEAAPLCPWREPERDLKALFPQATRYEVETRVLSGMRQQLGARLGRGLAPDETALHLNRVYQDATLLGTVLTRRVKGEHGAIEIVAGVGVDRRLHGLRLQRLREPDSVSKALQDPQWLGAFLGKTAESAWRLGTDVPDVPAEAGPSADAIVQGTRTLMVLLAAAETPVAVSPTVARH